MCHVSGDPLEPKWTISKLVDESGLGDTISFLNVIGPRTWLHYYLDTCPCATCLPVRLCLLG